MKGDFSRFTFDPKKRYTRVLLQQGRVLLDADWNEMAEIHCHDLRNVIRDLIGPHGGPMDKCGFRIIGSAASTRQKGQLRRGKRHLRRGDFLIGDGRYYVDGVACENSFETTYCTQPDFPSKPLKKGVYLVYLDVWERHITHIEDHEIREVDLGGQDTATRMKVVWQVKVHRLSRSMTCAAIDRCWLDFTHKWQPKNRGMLCAIAESNAGITPANRGYSGFESHLYRVEIHKAGRVTEKPTFKWSRENGTVAYVIGSIQVDTSSDISTVSLKKPSQSVFLALQRHDWVEVLDDYCVLETRPGSLLQVKEIDEASSQITLQGHCSESICRDLSRLCLVRRWDQKQGDGSEIQDGAVVIREGSDDNSWLDLENGIRIRFDPGGQYRTGDYWLIPARAETGGIEWPCSDGNPLSKPPFDIYHHFAPLSIINVDELGKVNVRDCRLAFRLKLQRPVVVKKKP
ncbi:MAG: hypothetical protein GTO29_03805 [Candidatus Latescibacteria bacterium]|nr:hypothetical protein [Candidatus Latescibacterota bacterium]NIO55200.1 hypothetical protein [Candidatus Latescibacterota bacterium]